MSSSVNIAPHSTTLTPRQIEILQGLADGLTLVELAENFGCSHQTLKNTLKNARERMGADTTNQAVAMGVRRRIIT